MIRLCHAENTAPIRENVIERRIEIGGARWQHPGDASAGSTVEKCPVTVEAKSILCVTPSIHHQILKKM